MADKKEKIETARHSRAQCARSAEKAVQAIADQVREQQSRRSTVLYQTHIFNSQNENVGLALPDQSTVRRQSLGLDQERRNVFHGK